MNELLLLQTCFAHPKGVATNFLKLFSLMEAHFKMVISINISTLQLRFY